MAIARATNRTAGQFITAKKEFNGSSISGRVVTNGAFFNTGKMSNDYAKMIKQDIESMPDGVEGFVVYSYATPIGWYTPATGWKKSSQKHSVTTSKHSGLFSGDWV